MTNLRLEKIINHNINNNQMRIEQQNNVEQNGAESEIIDKVNIDGENNRMDAGHDEESHGSHNHRQKKHSVTLDTSEPTVMQMRGQAGQPADCSFRVCGYTNAFDERRCCNHAQLNANIIVLRNCNTCHDYELSPCDPRKDLNPVPPAIVEAIKRRKMKEKLEEQRAKGKEKGRYEHRNKQRKLGGAVDDNDANDTGMNTGTGGTGANRANICQLCGRDMGNDKSGVCTPCGLKIRDVVYNYMDNSPNSQQNAQNDYYNAAAPPSSYNRNASGYATNGIDKVPSFSVIVLQDQDNASILEHLAHAINKSQTNLQQPNCEPCVRADRTRSGFYAKYATTTPAAMGYNTVRRNSQTPYFGRQAPPVGRQADSRTCPSRCAGVGARGYNGAQGRGAKSGCGSCCGGNRRNNGAGFGRMGNQFDNGQCLRMVDGTGFNHRAPMGSQHEMYNQQQDYYDWRQQMASPPPQLPPPHYASSPALCTTKTCPKKKSKSTEKPNEENIEEEKTDDCEHKKCTISLENATEITDLLMQALKLFIVKHATPSAPKQRNIRPYMGANHMGTTNTGYSFASKLAANQNQENPGRSSLSNVETQHRESVQQAMQTDRPRTYSTYSSRGTKFKPKNKRESSGANCSCCNVPAAGKEKCVKTKKAGDNSSHKSRGKGGRNGAREVAHKKSKKLLKSHSREEFEATESENDLRPINARHRCCFSNACLKPPFVPFRAFMPQQATRAPSILLQSQPNYKPHQQPHSIYGKTKERKERKERKEKVAQKKIPVTPRGAPAGSVTADRLGDRAKRSYAQQEGRCDGACANFSRNYYHQRRQQQIQNQEQNQNQNVAFKTTFGKNAVGNNSKLPSQNVSDFQQPTIAGNIDFNKAAGGYRITQPDCGKCSQPRGCGCQPTPINIRRQGGQNPSNSSTTAPKSKILSPVAHYRPGVLRSQEHYLLASNASRRTLVRTAAGVTTYEKPFDDSSVEYGMTPNQLRHKLSEYPLGNCVKTRNTNRSCSAQK